jgi:hypothetical protein
MGNAPLPQGRISCPATALPATPRNHGPTAFKGQLGARSLAESKEVDPLRTNRRHPRS